MKKISIVLVFFFYVVLTFAGQLSPCDLNSDGAVNILDYQLVVNMSLGLVPCTANINGPNVCNIVTAQRVIKAAFGGTCDVSGGSHYVQLTWTASTSSVSGYNIYRSNTSGGPYIKINSNLVNAVNYSDNSVSAGVTYYYVATAVDSSSNESVYSNQATATVPSP